MQKRRVAQVGSGTCFRSEVRYPSGPGESMRLDADMGLTKGLDLNDDAGEHAGRLACCATRGFMALLALHASGAHVGRACVASTRLRRSPRLMEVSDDHAFASDHALLRGVPCGGDRGTHSADQCEARALPSTSMARG